MARPKKHLNRRVDIINAAEILFEEKGFEKTTIEEIAQYIGVSKGSIYLDFKNKDEIHIAIIERQSNIFMMQMNEEIQKAKPPFLNAFKQSTIKQALLVFDMANSQKHSYESLMHINYLLKTELGHLEQQWVEFVETLLKKAFKNGEIEAFDEINNIAHLINISLNEFFPPYDFKYSVNKRTDLDKEDVRKIFHKDLSLILDIILNGLKNTHINNNQRNDLE